MLYLFGSIVLGKAVLVGNYLCRGKAVRGRLEREAQVEIMGLFISSFIKSLLYFGMMMLLMYIGWLLIILPVILSVLGV